MADVLCVLLMATTVAGSYLFEVVPQTVAQWRRVTVTFAWFYWCLPGAGVLLSR